MIQDQIIVPDRVLKSATTNERNRSSTYLKKDGQDQLSEIDINLKVLRHTSEGGSRIKDIKVPFLLKSTLKKQGSKINRLKRNSTISGLFQQIKQDVLNTLVDGKLCSLCQQSYEELLSLSNCEHQFCVNCLSTYANYKINVHDQILCPQENCIAQFNESGKIYQMLSTNLKLKYKQQKLWRQNKDNPNVRICPKQDCQSGLIDMLSVPPQCKNCHRTFCKQCQLETHQGKCEKAFQEMFKDWKRCSQCRMFIQKNDGCNHMTCKCGYQFCYICGSEWDNRHYQCGEPDAFQTPNRCGRIFYGFLFFLILPVIIIIQLLLSLLIILFGSILGAIFFPIFICSENKIRRQFCIWIALCFIGVIIIGSIVGIAIGFYGLFCCNYYLYQRYSRMCCP